MMLAPLQHPTYRRLFAAQVVALLGTGVATVGLALLAYDLAGDEAGAVLGTALAIKMVAYVSVAPVAGAMAQRVPRRRLLVAMDAVRAATALMLPLVDAVWQVYVLIFVLQSASAVFTPTFQATIPDILEDEHTYTEALSLSRLAYDLENLLSPTLAAAALALVSFHWLFAGTAAGFLVSAALVLSVRLPLTDAKPGGSVKEDTLKGLQIYLKTPRLKGLLALNLAAACAGAMVIVNTVVIVRGILGRTDGDVAIAQALFGGGSMVAALLLPRLLTEAKDRTVMASGAALLVGTMLGSAIGIPEGLAGWWVILGAWGVLGFGYSTVLTPAGRLLRRSAEPPDRPAVFAAQFALSHACWLATYSLAGWIGSGAGMQIAFAALALPAAAGLALALMLWKPDDPEALEHEHRDLPSDHPHVRDAERTDSGLRHSHAFRIDSLHHQWPTQG